MKRLFILSCITLFISSCSSLNDGTDRHAKANAAGSKKASKSKSGLAPITKFSAIQGLSRSHDCPQSAESNKQSSVVISPNADFSRVSRVAVPNVSLAYSSTQKQAQRPSKQQYEQINQNIKSAVNEEWNIRFAWQAANQKPSSQSSVSNQNSATLHVWLRDFHALQSGAHTNPPAVYISGLLSTNKDEQLLYACEQSLDLPLHADLPSAASSEQILISLKEAVTNWASRLGSHIQASGQ